MDEAAPILERMCRICSMTCGNSKTRHTAFVENRNTISLGAEGAEESEIV